MTNEELAVKIQQGNIEYYSELWEQNEKFFTLKASKFYNGCTERCISSGVEIDDLIQVCYFALVDAVKAFDDTQDYKLLAYTSYPLKNRFKELLGIRTSKRNPLNGSLSLDKPFDDDKELTYGNILPDETAEQEFRSIEDKMYNDSLRTALDDVANTVLNERERKVIEKRYYNSETQEAVAGELSITGAAVQQIINKSLQKMRNGYGKKILKPYADEIISSRAYTATGLNSFKNKWASSEELIIELLENKGLL